MKVFLQVIGTETVDTQPSVVLFFEHSRYMFNCGEGTQRFCAEHKIKMSKMKGIFVSSVSWEFIGGIPGLLLTLADSGITTMKIHGPSPLPVFFDAIKHFYYRPNMNIFVNQLASEQNAYKDEFISVSTIVSEAKLSAKEFDCSSTTKRFKSDECDDTSLPSCERSIISSAMKSDAGSSGPDNAFQCPPSRIFVSYFVQLPDSPGKFDVDKAISLNIPKGRLFGELQKGHSITLVDGLQIHPEQVISPSIPGSAFLVLYCPDEDSLVSHIENLQNYLCRPSLCCILHLSSEQVVSSPTYIQFLATLDPRISSFFFHSKASPQTIAFQGAACQQLKLHALDPHIFPLPYEGFSSLQNGAQHLMQIQLAPTFLVVRDYILSAVLKTTTVEDEKTEEQQRGLSIACLGTGACLPSKYRNVSSTMIFEPEKKLGLLFDCGEGTLGQLYRLFGKLSYTQYLADIQYVFISHMHADHHLGLIRILCHRRKYTSQPLTVIGPSYLQSWLTMYNCHVETLPDYLFVDAKLLEKEALEDEHSLVMKTVAVEHCPHAYGMILEVPLNGVAEKIVYSGDTRPCDRLVEMGKGALVLIHEATFEDSLIKEALERKHCTTSEAISVGERMNAKFTLLTHFSQRYPKIPVLDGIGQGKVGIAFDLMRFEVEHMEKLTNLLPEMKLLYDMGQDTEYSLQEI